MWWVEVTYCRSKVGKCYAHTLSFSNVHVWGFVRMFPYGKFYSGSGY